jgi:sialidase-1
VVDAQSGYLPNECVAVELADGSVYLNSRNHGGQKRRVYAVTPTAAEFRAAALDDTLVEPVVQASALRYSAIEQGGETNLVLFSNPATPLPARA